MSQTRPKGILNRETYYTLPVPASQLAFPKNSNYRYIDSFNCLDVLQAPTADNKAHLTLNLLNFALCPVADQNWPGVISCSGGAGFDQVS